MAGVASNWTRMVAFLRSLPRAVVFDGGLGEDLARRAAHGIRVRSIERQVDPKGRRWAPNAPAYAASARKRGKPIGVLDDVMLSEDEILGVPEITPTRVQLRYGRTPEVIRIARWFQQGVRARGRGTVRGRRVAGRRWRQPPRVFFDLDAEILRDLEEFARLEIPRRVRRPG